MKFPVNGHRGVLLFAQGSCLELRQSSEYRLNSSPIKCLALCKALEGRVSSHCCGGDGVVDGGGGVDEDEDEDDVGSCRTSRPTSTYCTSDLTFLLQLNISCHDVDSLQPITRVMFVALDFQEPW